MARVFDGAIPEYFEAVTVPVSTTPLSICCWFNSTDWGSSNDLVAIADASVSNHYFRLRALSNTSGTPRVISARTQQGGNNHQALSTSEYTLNTWRHAAAVFASASDRRAFLDGGSKGTETSTATPANLDVTSIGRVGDSSPGGNMDGRIAEVGMWNVALTDDEIAALASGISPLRVRRSSLQAYYPLFAVGGDAINYAGGGNTLTDTNTVTNGDHAPVGPMFGFGLGWQGAFTVAAAGGLGIPIAAFHYNHHLGTMRN